MVVYGVLILLASLTLVIANVEVITNPSKRCVPTASVTGACNKCVCTSEGVFHCHTLSCDHKEDFKKFKLSNGKECEPDYTYRQDTSVCSCSNTGYWRSQKCRYRFRHMLANKPTQKPSIGTNTTCTPNRLYNIDCNICICSEDGDLNINKCTNRVCTYKYKDERCILGDVLKTDTELCICSDISYFIDKRCIKLKNTTISEVKGEELDNAINIGSYWDDLKIKCKPFYIYMIDCTKCTCSGHGVLHCVNTDCKTQALLDVSANTTIHGRASFPEIRDGETCVPSQTYKKECNTCTCTSTRALICTKMACLDWKNRKAKTQKKLDHALRQDEENVNTIRLLPKVKNGVLCKPGKLYMSKCRRCYCTKENKIICSNKTRAACEFDEDGNSVPIVAPEDVRPTILHGEMEDLETLARASEKCDPGKSYKVDCNYCLCLENNNLLCQRKICISYEDMNRLEAQEMSGKPCTDGESSTKNCKTCDCVKGLTKCQPVPNCKIEHKLLLNGDADVEASIELDGTQKKCVPNTIYKSDCNKCYCQPSGNLRCTQKTCLNYSQVKLLKKQRDYLEAHGL